jgi:hypothetical protein
MTGLHVCSCSAGQAQHQQEVNPDRWFVQMVVEHLVAIALIALVMLRAYL